MFNFKKENQDYIEFEKFLAIDEWYKKYWTSDAIMKLIKTTLFSDIQKFVANFILMHSEWTTITGNELVKKGFEEDYILNQEGISATHKLAIALTKYSKIKLQTFAKWLGCSIQDAKRYAEFLQDRMFYLKQYANELNKEIEVTSEHILAFEKQKVEL